MSRVRSGGIPTALATSTRSTDTSSITLKQAAMLALIGTLLLTLLAAWDFFKTVSGVLNDVVPAIALIRSLIYLLASLSLTVFFYLFHQRDAR